MTIEALGNYSVKQNQPTNVKSQTFSSNPETNDGKSKLLASNNAKIAVGAGLAALAAIGIYIATKGKTNKTVQEVQESANTIKEMTIDVFKQAGNKFNRGKAVTSSGEAFIGNITHQTNDGKNIVIEYENGILKKSTKYDGGNVISQKNYEYGKNGDLSIIQDGKLILNKITDTGNGLQTFKTKKGFVIKNTNTDKIKFLQLEGQGQKYFYDNGTLKAVEIKNNHHTNTIFYSSDGSKNLRVQDGSLLEFYDKKGVPTDRIQIITRENGYQRLEYGNLLYDETRGFNAIDRVYSYGTPQGTHGMIFRQSRTKDGKNVIETNLLFRTTDNNNYRISKKGKDIQIERSVDKKKSDLIAKDSDEYKNVLAQSTDFMKQLLAKYKTDLGLQRQANEDLKEFNSLKEYICHIERQLRHKFSMQ